MEAKIDYNDDNLECKMEPNELIEAAKMRVEIDHLADMLAEIKQDIKTTQRLLIGVILAVNVFLGGGKTDGVVGAVEALKGTMGF